MEAATEAVKFENEDFEGIEDLETVRKIISSAKEAEAMLISGKANFTLVNMRLQVGEFLVEEDQMEKLKIIGRELKEVEGLVKATKLMKEKIDKELENSLETRGQVR